MVQYFVLKRHSAFSPAVPFQADCSDLCKTHALKLMTENTKKWGKSDFSIQITRNSISICLETVNLFQLGDPLAPCDSTLIGRHNVWESWSWTELTANCLSLPVQSERALEPLRELLDFEKCLLGLASPGTVVLKTNLPFWKVHFCACPIRNTTGTQCLELGVSPVMWQSVSGFE